MKERYNFDERPDRSSTGSTKYGMMGIIWGREDLLPMWIADMEFLTPDFIRDSMRTIIDKGVLGYTMAHPDWRPSVTSWLGRRHGWSLREDEIAYIPGIMRGIAFVFHTFAAPGDKVLVMNPVYYPFFKMAEENGMTVVRNDLIIDNEFVIDFNRLEKDMQGAKLFILSNPQNPGGRVWTPDELKRIAEIADRCGTLVISDEIHSDLTHPQFKHTPYATVSNLARENSISFNSPAKAFNIPGILSSYAVVHNDELRAKFFRYLSVNEFDSGGIFSQLVAVEAYRHGEEWLSQVLEYICGNIRYVEEFLSRNVPQIKFFKTQASYLMWLDCRAVSADPAEVDKFFVEKARLALNNGALFGSLGEGFMRMNVGAPRFMIEEAMERLAAAFR